MQELSIEELRQLTREVENGGLHIWIKHLDCDFVCAAVTDITDKDGLVALWAAGDYVAEADYGVTWLAYREGERHHAEDPTQPR